MLDSNITFVDETCGLFRVGDSPFNIGREPNLMDYSNTNMFSHPIRCNPDFYRTTYHHEPLTESECKTITLSNLVTEGTYILFACRKRMSDDIKKKWKVKVWLRNDVQLETEVILECTEKKLKQLVFPKKFRLTYEPIDT